MAAQTRGSESLSWSSNKPNPKNAEGLRQDAWHTAEESLTTYSLLNALTSSEETDSDNSADLLKLLQSIPAPAPDAHKPTPLHLAVRCAKPSVFPFVLEHRPDDLNIQDGLGQTPLHIASALGRSDLVSVLLAQPNIDDGIADNASRTCFELAATPEVSRLIQTSRSQLNANYVDLLTTYVAHGQAEPLVACLQKPRARCIDFSARTVSAPTAGTTVMHEAARRRDLDLLKLAHQKGADVLVRDSKGKVPMDLAKDDKTRAWFKQIMNAEGKALRGASLDSNAASGQSTPGSALGRSASQLNMRDRAPPPRRGYLQKWTNLARGYKNRWFVLQNGQLSYYRHQSEEGKASRSTIAMDHAQVTGPSQAAHGDANKFEISSDVAKFRFFVKADHPLEAIRWVEDLKAHMDYASGNLQRRRSTHETLGRPSGNLRAPSSLSMTQAQESTDSLQQSSATPEGVSTPNIIPPTPQRRPSQTPSLSQGDETPSGASSSVTNLPAAISRRLSSSTFKKFIPGMHSGQGGSSLTNMQGANSSTSSIPRSTDGSMSSSLQRITSSPSSMQPHDDGIDNGSLLSFGNEEGQNGHKTAPHQENFVLLENSAKAQIEACEQLVSSMSTDPATQARQADVKEALRQSIKRLQAMYDEYVDHVKDREQWFCRRYESEIEARRLWEDNLAHLAKQQAELESELQREAQKGSRRKKELKNLQARSQSPSLASPPATARPPLPEEGESSYMGRDRSDTVTGPPSSSGAGQSAAAATAAGAAVAGGAGAAAATKGADAGEDESSDDDDDEFFEAVDSGQLEMSVDPPLTEPTSAVFHEKDLPEEIKAKLSEKDLVYAGYKHPRTELPIGVDDRPDVSLWSILKNSIGKDLTKISFPVSFNEPTSMLQRMAEDMEFSEVLDAAVMHNDSTERIAFVAAFAMSNYSSTIGRIAKPFNPMLSETFEYVSLDKRYRYMSEQVSHHPPISACIAESPNYRYFGEVDAKNKFLGKSFEIRPTGMAHCELRLSPEAAPDMPTDPLGLASEHYSWKKVTSSVSNFIWGSPIIDHYGDMTVTNHFTGDTCQLTFKPRGWKGSNSMEIRGKVLDKHGKLQWEIAGRWSTQLVARRAGSGSGELQPDAQLPDKPEYMLLWKNSEKPSNSPFNLTPYAITLNGKPDELVPWLPPTDCRLRPDLHAFEAGKFEEANQLKTGLEEVQRNTRRKRETGQLPPHHPRWFTRKQESDTQEGYWEPSRLKDGSLEYWNERERVGKAKVNGEEAQWTEVEPIFGDFALL